MKKFEKIAEKVNNITENEVEITASKEKESGRNIGGAIANVLTCTRIVCGLLILVFPAFSKWYFAFYLFGGFTDAIDGTVARKLGHETEFGSKLDTAADFVFAISVVIKLIFSFNFPTVLIIWLAIITAIKIANVIIGYKKYNCFVTVHSFLNKVCGFFAFTIPLFIGGQYSWQSKALAAIFVCAFATFCAICETFSILSGKTENR